MPINVVNMRNGYIPNTIKIDRTTSYGNPFPEKDSDRNTCIALFKKELYKCLREKNNTEHFKYNVMIEFLIAMALTHNNNETIHLACWCAPKSCHGDVYKVLIIGLAKKIKEGTYHV